MTYKKLIKLITCLGFILTTLNTTAQVSILQNAIDKLYGHKNFSYQYIDKQKEAFGDTSIQEEKFIFLKAAEDKEVGYHFRYEFKNNDMKLPARAIYDGKNSIALSLADSTYQGGEKPIYIFNQSIFGDLNWLENFLKNKPSKVVQSSDTIVNAINSYHLVFNTRDTIVNKDHLYTRIHLFIDKATGLPVGKLARARTDYGKEVENFYDEKIYFNYITDQADIDPALFTLPKGFQPSKPKPAAETALLTPGMIAPGWTLYDTDDKKTSLAQLKGKVILLDFFFVGCGNCMSSLASLDRFDEKYKNSGFTILSISDRDNKKLVTEFRKAQRIKNQMYPNARDVAKLYHITAAPTFYLIGKDGKIVNVTLGYSDDFEKKMTDIIDGLLKKS
jgi:peroxiredoxin